MPETLPSFRYHPDPVGSGSVVPSDVECLCCERARGWVYTGPVYAVDEIEDELCPWCVADGRAAEQFDAGYTDLVNVPEAVPQAVRDEVLRRTPGYTGWQQEVWQFHCDDACAFVTPVGAVELESLPAAARTAVAAAAGADRRPDGEIDEVLASLDRRYGPTAYLFRCLHCKEYVATWDCA